MKERSAPNGRIFEKPRQRQLAGFFVSHAARWVVKLSRGRSWFLHGWIWLGSIPLARSSAGAFSTQ